MKGQILLVSGPSGSGKSTLLKRLFSEEKGIYFSISSTTRAIRDGEINGVHYNFISKEEFEEGIKNDEFLEWAQVHKNYYGTSLKPVKEQLELGNIVVFDIDVQGFAIAREKFKSLITSVFITTTNKKELKKRLESRGTDNAKTIENRLMNAVGEMEHILEYDYFLINDDIQKSYKGLRSIVRAMRLKSTNINLRQTVENWIDC
ncbi:guanylate kinase [Campylobacter suis]|uniref:Guanylate kinase n=1 Tax=Campylobacter suis TaxID=2790657 RepID=A0ABM8Q792_9BACT|nr:guanylate kinase [Campylobacter suis]CAD7288680.1 Guanylate kinase [Campylobacter suis]